MKITLTDKVFAFILVISIIILASFHIGKASERKAVDNLLVQQSRYEMLLDSTCEYIYNKYEEYLPDTFWEGDIYFQIYEGFENSN